MLYPLATREKMAALDKSTIEDFGLPGRILMETAGREAARIIRELYDIKGKNILILCGPGNNGGDGWVAARYLLSSYANVSVFFTGESKKLGKDSYVNKELYEKAGGKTLYIRDKLSLKEKISYIERADFFIDALFGIGLDRRIEGFPARLILLVNKSRAPVFSMDIPSGVKADNGLTAGIAIKAEHCFSFGLAKPAHFFEPGKSLRGKLHLIDIGIPELIHRKIPTDTGLANSLWAASKLPRRSPESHKGDFGHILFIGGVPRFRGAIVLAARAALNSGAGLVSLAIPEDSLPLPELKAEIMLNSLPGKGEDFSDKAPLLIEELIRDKSLIAAGPGMGKGENALKLLRVLIAGKIPLVLDADALNLLALNPDLMEKLKKRLHPTLLTPHPKEMARLAGLSLREVLEDKIETAKNFAVRYKCHLLLKGAGSIAARPDGFCTIISKGNSGMASGGSGDVLCGIVSGLMAQKLRPEDAAPLASFVHGMAADILAETRGPFGYLPSDTIEKLPEVFSLLSTYKNLTLK